jgi:thiamine kinase-like enzyme
MNIIENYVQQNWLKFGLDGKTSSNQLSSLILTPRFRASNHLICLVMPVDKPEPIIVVKIPRRAESSGLAREAYNLRAVQQSRYGGYHSIPRLLAYEPFLDRTVLVETALIGQPMEPSLIRKDLQSISQLVFSWILELHQHTKISSIEEPGWYSRLIEKPLDYFGANFPLMQEEIELLKKTRAIADQIKGEEIPLVFEHGDMSHPNLLLVGQDKLGVLDWETSTEIGLPFSDLFFFLKYASISLSKAKTQNAYIDAFKNAFFKPGSWATSYMMSYSEKMHISPEIASILFVLCWARYTIGMVQRMQGERTNPLIDNSTANWLRSNRYYTFWQYAVQHYEEFALHQK